MAPLRNVEEIKNNEIGLIESTVMEKEQSGIRVVAPSSGCMVCSKTYERNPEMLITILNHTYCKICITSNKLQTDDANEFIIRNLAGWRSANRNILNGDYEDLEKETDSLEEFSDESRGLPLGYVYPNSKFMQDAQEGTRNKKMPYSSLRINSDECKSKQKAQKGTRNMKKGPISASLRMNTKPPIQSHRKKQKAAESSRKRMWPFSINPEAAPNELTLWSTGRRHENNICDEDNWLHEKGRGELLLINDISDDDDGDKAESESVNKI